MTTPPRITLLPAPSRPGCAYVVRGAGERLCLPLAPTLAPRAGEWYTRATWPGSSAAWEAASALPAAAACALAAAVSPPPGARQGRPPRPPATPDAELTDAAMAAGGYASRMALAAAVAARSEGHTTAGAVARAFTRARAPGGALSEEIRGVLRGVVADGLGNKAI